MATREHKLYWQSQLIGVIAGVTTTDYPWVRGRFEPRQVSEELREVLGWFAAQAEADDLQDPPFDPRLLEGWFIDNVEGERHELLVPPLIDFDQGVAEWR